MSDHPHTREAIERWRQGKVNVFDALAELEDQRDATQAECLEQARLLGKSAEREDILRTKIEQFRVVVEELIRLLDIEEESDSGTVFRPNKISSCRVMDGMKINQCLKKLKELATE
jgi:hypothetical protein